MAIRSFSDGDTEQLSCTGRRRRWTATAKIALRKLDMLDAAVILSELRVPPGNRPEPLAGNLAGLHSIRINDQFRLCFRSTQESPEDVHIIDTH